MVKIRNYSIIALILAALFACNLTAQEVLWAEKVLGFSSELSTKRFSANQILGEPSVMYDFGFSNCAWTPKNPDSPKEEWIKVSFRQPAYVQQISISENFNPGTISKILLYDSAGFEHLVYNTFSNTPIDEKGRLFNVFISRTKFRVFSLKLILRTNEIPGWNQIDAIGISDSNIPAKLKINDVKDSDLKFKPENLGTNINSKYHELAPVISPDGHTLYFTRDGHPENVGIDKKQDIWYSTINEDSTFSPAKNFGTPINNELNNYALSITPDGNSMLLGNVYKPVSKIEHGVSMSYFDGEKWSFPEKLKVEDFYNLNRHATYCLGNDAKTLLSAIERDDSYGDIDIYVSFYNDDGTWTAPMNLGPIVNTAAEEASPFLAADGVTLYYSTSGYPGYGNNDIFITRRLDDTWKNWSKPENMGPVLNTVGWDAYFTIPASGDYAYFVSTKASYGFEDIFRLILPESMKPQPVVLVSGRVINSKTDKPVSAKIRYETLPDGKEVGIARSNPRSGVYKIVLPAGKKFGFLAEAGGFVAVHENLDLRKTQKYQEIARDLYLVPVEDGQVIKMNNIFFEFAKFDLLPDSYSELNRVVTFLLANPDIKIEIHGHTCDIGSDERNQILSENRAKAVAQYLIENGIKPTRLSIKGYGRLTPLRPNTTEANRRKNRRVEFLIIKDKKLSEDSTN